MTVFRVRHETKGYHVHCRFFSAPREGATFAKLGDFVETSDKFWGLKRAMSGVEFIDETYATPEEQGA